MISECHNTKKCPGSEDENKVQKWLTLLLQPLATIKRTPTLSKLSLMSPDVPLIRNPMILLEEYWDTSFTLHLQLSRPENRTNLSHLRLAVAAPRRRLPSLDRIPADIADGSLGLLLELRLSVRRNLSLLLRPQSVTDVISAWAASGGRISVSEVRLGRSSLLQSSSSSGRRRSDILSALLSLYDSSNERQFRPFGSYRDR